MKKIKLEFDYFEEPEDNYEEILLVDDKDYSKAIDVIKQADKDYDCTDDDCADGIEWLIYQRLEKNNISYTHLDTDCDYIYTIQM